MKTINLNKMMRESSNIFALVSVLLVDTWIKSARLISSGDSAFTFSSFKVAWLSQPALSCTPQWMQA